MAAAQRRELGLLSFKQNLGLSDNSLLLIKALQQAGVLESEMTCTCGKSMILKARIEVQDEIAWRCGDNRCLEGFNHLTVNHSVSFVSVDGVHTQQIESVWSQVKSSLKLKRGTTKGHLAGYLDLYSFLCDARHQGKLPVEFFLELIQVGMCY